MAEFSGLQLSQPSFGSRLQTADQFGGSAPEPYFPYAEASATPSQFPTAMAPLDTSWKDTYSTKLSMPPLAYEPVGDPGAGKTASNVLSGISKFAALAPGIGSVVSALTGAGSLIMNWWSAGKQLDAQKAAQKQSQQLYDQQMSESKRRYDLESQYRNEQLAAQKEQALLDTRFASQKQAHVEKMDEATLAANKEQKTWDRWLLMMQSMTNMMSTPASRTGVAQLYKR